MPPIRSRLLPFSLVFALATVATAEDKQKPAPPAGPRLPAGIALDADVEYARNDGVPVHLDLYRPEKAKGPLPVLVWVHGGGWIGGSKSPCPAAGMVLRGYAVASVQYRLSGTAPFPAQIEDVKAAVRWIRANAKERGLDGGRIGAWGSSAGGHLVALLGTSGGAEELEGSGGNPRESSRVRAVVDYCGPTDLLQFDGRGSRIQAGAPGSLIATLLGGTLCDKKDLAAKANPIAYVTKDDPPFLIFHGDRDDVVPLHQSELLHAALEKAGVEVTLETLRGAGHGFGSPRIAKAVEEFFDRHVKNARAEKPEPAATATEPCPPTTPTSGAGTSK
jgi:acetyl esterase/lipase